MKNNNEERKCKICGKTLVGNNKAGICSACQKKVGDMGVNFFGILGIAGTTAWGLVKAFTKKD